MAAKKILDESITQSVQQEDTSYHGPKVTIFLPALEEEGNGIKVDQYERVTIANELGEETFMIHRGEPVEVPVPVFVVLKQKYPKL